MRCSKPGGNHSEYFRKYPASAAVGNTELSTSHFPVSARTSHQEACGAEFASLGSACHTPCLSSKLASRYLITALTRGSFAGAPTSVRIRRAFIAPRGDEPHQRVSLSRQEANPPSLFWNFANSRVTASRLPCVK